MIAGSNTRVATSVGRLRRQLVAPTSNGSTGQPRQVTCAGAITSALKPSAHSSRLAATSAYTSPFAFPYFTFTTSSLLMAHRNFGVLPESGCSGCT